MRRDFPFLFLQFFLPKQLAERTLIAYTNCLFTNRYTLKNYLSIFQKKKYSTNFWFINRSTQKKKIKIALKKLSIFSHYSKSSFFVQKSTLISRENCRFFLGEKLVKIVVVLDFLAVDKFDFTRKIVKKIWVKKSWKCWGLSKLNFWTKIWLLE